MLQQKIETHKKFWRGEGPCLILIPSARQALYDLSDYPARFADPQKMWEAEFLRVQGEIDWPTDGIPTVRPNLGVAFIPAMAGQGCTVSADAMPWPGEHLTRDQIRAARDTDVAASEMMRKAAGFYDVHRRRAGDAVAAYFPDTQGVFDIAHMLYGDEIFYELPDPDHAEWIEELLEISLGLYTRATAALKTIMPQPSDSMIHGHGTSQGVFFPTAGVRISEDTPTLISPEMIDRYVMPYIARACRPFGGGAFVHFCGRHEEFFSRLCQADYVRAVDLGNPEMYDLTWLLEQCAQSGTVFHSRVAALEGESWEPYIRRIGRIVQQTGARVILRPTVFPDSSDQAKAMLELWRKLTG